MGERHCLEMLNSPQSRIQKFNRSRNSPTDRYWKWQSSNVDKEKYSKESSKPEKDKSTPSSIFRSRLPQLIRNKASQQQIKKSKSNPTGFNTKKFPPRPTSASKSEVTCAKTRAKIEESETKSTEKKRMGRYFFAKQTEIAPSKVYLHDVKACKSQTCLCDSIVSTTTDSGKKTKSLKRMEEPVRCEGDVGLDIFNYESVHMEATILQINLTKCAKRNYSKMMRELESSAREVHNRKPKPKPNSTAFSSSLDKILELPEQECDTQDSHTLTLSQQLTTTEQIAEQEYSSDDTVNQITCSILSDNDQVEESLVPSQTESKKRPKRSRIPRKISGSTNIKQKSVDRSDTETQTDYSNESAYTSAQSAWDRATWRSPKLSRSITVIYSIGDEHKKRASTKSRHHKPPIPTPRPKVDQATQMYEHLTPGQLYCHEWVMNNLFHIESFNPFTTVVDSAIKSLSNKSCCSSSTSTGFSSEFIRGLL